MFQFYAYLMSNGSVLRTEVDGLLNQHGHPEIERIFGMFFFEWHDDAAREMVFKDAISYESNVLRKFIITGFQHLRRRTASISTIGTAPVSPDHSVSSLDSERTIPASHSGSVNPGPVLEPTSAIPTVGDITGRFHRLGHDWNVSGNPHGGSRGLVTDQFALETPTRQARPSVQPYRPPHSRASTAPKVYHEQADNWRTPRTESRPVYYAPHSTAHNVRSSSDPFGPAPPVAPTSKRSRSDATRQMPILDRQAHDASRTANPRFKPAKK